MKRETSSKLSIQYFGELNGDFGTLSIQLPMALKPNQKKIGERRPKSSQKDSSFSSFRQKKTLAEPKRTQESEGKRKESMSLLCRFSGNEILDSSKLRRFPRTKINQQGAFARENKRESKQERGSRLTKRQKNQRDSLGVAGFRSSQSNSRMGDARNQSPEKSTFYRGVENEKSFNQNSMGMESKQRSFLLKLRVNENRSKVKTNEAFDSRGHNRPFSRMEIAERPSYLFSSFEVKPRPKTQEVQRPKQLQKGWKIPSFLKEQTQQKDLKLKNGKHVHFRKAFRFCGVGPTPESRFTNEQLGLTGRLTKEELSKISKNLICPIRLVHPSFKGKKL